ncbi:MAG: flagellar export protein FliJ [Lachnospiraceae bacterium]|jgi:flagellar export protein FliJ|nr:flagellar export protein FliJ [Lachnospiraceae bacterium]MCI8779412.1 flagellar export protein FliJ [Lachnospiraceae bacterium]
MAKFIFKMESILSIKYKLEDQAKAEYGMEVAKLREEERKLEVLIAKKEAYQDALTKAVQDALVIREIKVLENSVENAKYNINVQKFVIKQQQQRVDQAREKLDNAMKERKTYEKLKEKAFEQFKMEIEAQERKEIDELVSFRFRSAQESEE